MTRRPGAGRGEHPDPHGDGQFLRFRGRIVAPGRFVPCSKQADDGCEPVARNRAGVGWGSFQGEHRLVPGVLMNGKARSILGSGLLGLLAVLTMGAEATQGGYRAEIEKWRQDRETRLKSDTGWLTVSGLFWLKEGNNRFGSDPAGDIVLPAS